MNKFKHEIQYTMQYKFTLKSEKQNTNLDERFHQL